MYEYKIEKFIKKYNLWLTGYGRTKDRARKHLRAQVNRYRKTPQKMVGHTKYGTIARCDLIEHLNKEYDERNKESRTEENTNTKSEAVQEVSTTSEAV